MSKEPNDFVVTMKAMQTAAEKMKVKCGGIGEPAICLPLSDIKTFVDNDGEIQAIIGIKQFICMVDNVLRRS